MELKDYLESALPFVESAEMREHWRNEIPLMHDPIETCRDIILASRTSVGSKLKAIRQFPQDEETLSIIAAAEYALDKRSSNQGDIFKLVARFPEEFDEEDNGWNDEELCPSFESVIKAAAALRDEYVKDFELPDPPLSTRLWFQVFKYVPDINDKDAPFSGDFYWILNADGEMISFDGERYNRRLYKDSSEQERQFSYALEKWFIGNSQLEYMPVPFEPGDIITVDMLPFFEAVHALVIYADKECGGYDCCGACITLTADKDGNLKYGGGLKHIHEHHYSSISTLFRAARFDGELAENERILGEQSIAIKNAKDPVAYGEALSASIKR